MLVAYMQVKTIAEENNVAFLTLGFDPKWQTVDVPIMPKNRYKCVCKGLHAQHLQE